MSNLADKGIFFEAQRESIGRNSNSAR